MKAIPVVLALGAFASFALAPASFAAISCPNRTPAAITAPASDAGRACQNAIAKAAAGYVKTQLKTDAKCLSAQVPGQCPTEKDVSKNQKAALKARDAVVKACTGSVNLLNTSYSALTDPADVASCTLSQNNAEGKLLAQIVNGTPGRVVVGDKVRDKCAKTLNSASVKYALGALQNINKCLASNIKAGTAGNLATTCVGQWTGGTYTAPSDLKTADKLAGLLGKLEASITKDCSAVNFVNIQSIYACGGSSSAAGFATCLACESWDSTLDILAAQYSETGTVVSPGAGAIQTAIDAASPGDKLLIKSGLYQEEISMTSNVLNGGLQLVGCGGATNERPAIDPPTIGGPFTNGIFASSVDGLLFQSLDIGPWPENGIFVTGANGVTFRDVVADAEGVSLYSVFPVTSNNVLVEGCKVEHVADAGIYVGQSTNIIVRYNTVLENVAGIEIENSSDASVHNNYANGNTGGILIFKLPNPPVQLSNNHDIFFNVSTNNNRPNVGAGTVGTIPDGTGMLVLSNDDGDFHHNIFQGNDSFGFVMVDQEVINFLASPNPPPFPTTSPDQKMTGNRVFANLADASNGTNPDLTPPNTTQGQSGQIVYAVFEEDPGPNFNNNCAEGNLANVATIIGTILGNCPGYP